MGRWHAPLLGALIVVLAACTSNGPEAVLEGGAGATSSPPTGQVETPTSEQPSPKEASTQAAIASETPSAQLSQEGATSPTTPPTVAPTEAPAVETAEPRRNGTYEGTYFRGLATAPVTMIDYSDFL
jgi:hypothetical protein